MRHRISITLDEDTLLRVRELLRSKTYRNKSHFFEIAANNLLEVMQ
ncbi:ribbon-helix-helix protein, CopG family [Candidatus Woesearchaeota archaeon]|nr:ribbon-helix-helix protein, CopG family [Candidatus Woesearchaeota archaeon]